MENFNLLADVALSFAAPGNFDEQLTGVLRSVGERLQVSRTYVFLDSPDGRTTSNTHEWCSPGIAPMKAELQDIPYGTIPSWPALLKLEGRIFATELASLPSDLRAILEPQGIHSILVYPLFIEGSIRGFIGFDECRPNRSWTPAEIQLLRTISGLISSVYERNLAQSRLRRSEDNFRLLFDTLDDLLLVGGENGRILYANDAVRRKLGYSAGELLEMSFLDFHLAEDREEAAVIISAMERHERDSCPLPLRCRDGRALPVETRIWHGSWDGKPCIFGLSKDLSAEQEALQKFSTLFERNPALMVITDQATRSIVDVNEAFLLHLGYERREVLGKTSTELQLFAEPSQQKIVAAALEREGAIKNVELAARHKDGTILHGLFSGEIIRSQGRRYFLSVMVDITEQISLREKLESQRRRYKNIIESTRLGTWEWNVQTGELRLNERWAKIIGYRLEELEPLNISTWSSLAHPEDLARSDELLRRHFAGESDYYEMECRMRHKDGRWIWVLDRGKVIHRDREGKPEWMFGTHADITERKELEDRVVELSIRDPLTGLFNRRHLFEPLEGIVADCRRTGRHFCLSMMDLDHFKQVNDRYGHLAGDEVLKSLAGILQRSIRPYDLAARFGGEEFVLVQVGADLVGATIMLERVMLAVRAARVEHESVSIGYTLSCGLVSSAEIEPADLSAQRLVELADQRLYAAKEAGRDRLVSS